MCLDDFSKLKVFILEKNDDFLKFDFKPKLL